MLSIPIRIRPFQREYQTRVQQLILDGLEEHFGYLDEKYNRDLKDIMGTYIDHGHIFLVATSAEQVVGTGALLVEDEACQGQIVRVSVCRHYRREGIGGRLVTELLAHACEKQLSRVLVETNHDWFDAIRLYQRYGFKEYARDEDSIYFELVLTYQTPEQD